MFYKSYYDSPLGKILLVSNETSLAGLWIYGQKYFLETIKEDILLKDNIEILEKSKKWLDRYFNLEKPEINELSLAPIGGDFRQIVWKQLCKIPYGKTTTYGNIAKNVAKELNKTSMSAQAIGNAVGHNPISIIIPCHRVIGTSGNLTGYAGGIDKKIQLLKLEKVNTDKFFIPSYLNKKQEGKKVI